jgi:hypothetical protein
VKFKVTAVVVIPLAFTTATLLEPVPVSTGAVVSPPTVLSITGYPLFTIESCFLLLGLPAAVLLLVSIAAKALVCISADVIDTVLSIAAPTPLLCGTPSTVCAALLFQYPFVIIALN